MTPRESLEVKERILQSAQCAFAQHGFDGATVRQIAEQSNTNQALISYHFGGKEQLFFALFECDFPRFSPFEEGDHAVDVLADVVRKMVNFKWSHPELAKMMHQEMSMQTCRAGKLKDFFEPLWQRVSKTLQVGKLAGDFDFEDAQTTLGCVMSVLIFPRELTVCAAAKEADAACMNQAIKSSQDFVLRAIGYKPSTGI